MMDQTASRLDKVNAAVRYLNAHLQNRNVSTKEYFNGMEAVFELIDQPWETQNDPTWQEGYEQCMVDIVDALADEWGVPVWAQVGLEGEL